MMNQAFIFLLLILSQNTMHSIYNAISGKFEVFLMEKDA